MCCIAAFRKMLPVQIRIGQKQKISSEIQKRFSDFAHWLLQPTYLSLPATDQSGNWHLAFFLSKTAGCQGFTGPIPSTFLDRIAFKRTDAKINDCF